MSDLSLTLRRNADGATATMSQPGEAWESAEFIWTDGNYACDCNRHVFFGMASDPEFDEEFPCGDSAYSLIAVNGRPLDPAL